MLKLAKIRVPKYRVYVAEEPGAKLVRHNSVATLAKALNLAGKWAEAVAVEVRLFWNGRESVLKVVK